MKKTIALLCCALFLTAAVALAAGPRTYQATGEVLAVKDGVVTVDKGKEGKWEIALGALPAPAVGAKVTIEYTMTAAKIEVKPAPAAKPAAPAGKPAAPPKK
jgi:hypothetical protein